MIRLIEMTDLQLIILALVVLTVCRAAKYPLDLLMASWDAYWMRRWARAKGLVDQPGAPFE